MYICTQNTEIIEIRESRRKGRAFRHHTSPRPSGRREGLNPRGRRGCTRPRRIVAAAGRGRRQSCARGRSSRAGSAPREHRHDFSRVQDSLRLRRGGPGSAGSWSCTSTGRIPYKNKNQRRVYAVSRAAERPIRTAEALAAQRGRSGARKSSRCTVRQEPASHHGINGLILCTVRRSTAVGNAVPSRGCPQLLTGSRQGVQSSHFVRVLCFLPRRPYPLLFASTANAGPELSQPASTPVLSAGRLLPAMSTRQNLFCIVLGAVPDRSLTLRGAALVTCSSACRSGSRRVREYFSRSRYEEFRKINKLALKSHV